jgi:uncharacterized cupin superfamily protein
MNDRHPNVVHAPSLAWIEPVSAPYGDGRAFAVRAKRLGAAAGGQRLGCALYELHPGKRSFPFHFHLAQEEALYMLEGEANLRLGAQELTVVAGDYVALPAGAAHSHQLINSSRGIVRYLCLSTMELPEVAVYPDSKKLGILGGPASVDAAGSPLIQLARHGESLGYYDGEEG